MHEQPDDRWMTVTDPVRLSPPNPDDDPTALGIYADRSDVAAMIAVEIQAPAVPCHVVRVCRPGPPPKIVHEYIVNRLPPKRLETAPNRSYVDA